MNYFYNKILIIAALLKVDIIEKEIKKINSMEY